MKLVKYYGWEAFFEKKLISIRVKEEALSFWTNILKLVNVCLVFWVPPASAFVIFLSSELNVAALKSTLAFTTLTLFNILRFPLVLLPKALRAFSGLHPRCLLEPIFANFAAAADWPGARCSASGALRRAYPYAQPLLLGACVNEGGALSLLSGC
jgi:hypothetical protein